MPIFKKISLLALAIAVIAAFAPWAEIVAHRAERVLTARGLTAVRVHVSELGWRRIVFDDVRFSIPLEGGAVELTGAAMALGFPPSTRLQGEMRALDKTFSVVFDAQVFSRPRTAHLTVRTEGFPVEKVAGVLSGGRVFATGVVTGAADLTADENGTLRLGRAAFRSQGGILKTDPAVVPGEGDSMAFTQNVLKNFHYTELTLTREGLPDAPVFNLALSGANPDVAGGRAVKLNVRLSGDVLDLARQNLLLLNNPLSSVTP